MALILCIPSDVASYLFKDYVSFFDKQSFRTDTIFILNISRENNSEKKNGGLMVLVLGILSAEALYLFQVS